MQFAMAGLLLKTLTQEQKRERGLIHRRGALRVRHGGKENVLGEQRKKEGGGQKKQTSLLIATKMQQDPRILVGLKKRKYHSEKNVQP